MADNIDIKGKKISQLMILEKVNLTGEEIIPVALNGANFGIKLESIFGGLQTLDFSSVISNNSVDAGKQYYNNKENVEINSYNGFSPIFSKSVIVSTNKISFTGNKILKEVDFEEKEGNLYIYLLEFIQIATDDYKICVSVKIFE